MNVFVLCTGRCGSTTFIKACEHIKNYSAAHESKVSRLGEERFDYPENHIEADNRLSWLTGRLDKKYADDAFYVHLRRNDEATAKSFTKRYRFGMIQAYRGNGVLLGIDEETDPLAVSLDYCATVNSNIELFLKDKTRKMSVSLENIDTDFRDFWERIGAEGDLESALAEFNQKYNASKNRNQRSSSRPSTARRMYGRIKRLVR